MSTVQRAVKMLKQSKKEALAYVATLSVSTCLLFLFVNIQKDANFLSQAKAMDQAGKDMNNMIGGVLTLIIIAVCFANTFIVNNYFNRSKAQELCVYLSSGMNVMALAKYLLVQNFILLMIAVLSGGVFGCFLHVLMNLLINLLLGLQNPLITLTIQGVILWLVILSVELIYLVMVNVGYAYKAELKDLLMEARTMRSQDFRGFRLPTLCYQIVAIAGLLIMIFCEADGSFLSLGASFGIIGIHGFLHRGVSDRIEKNKYNHRKLKFVDMMVQGNFLELLNSSYLYIILVMCSVMLMCTIFPVVEPYSYLMILTSVAYMLILIVMAISIIFKVMVASNKRKESFDVLKLLGGKSKEMKICIRKEMIKLFTYVLFLPLIYSMVICIRYIQSGMMSTMTMLFILGSYIVICIICGVISYLTYAKKTLKQQEENENDLCD